jgi:hypothetical protein
MTQGELVIPRCGTVYPGTLLSMLKTLGKCEHVAGDTCSLLRRIDQFVASGLPFSGVCAPP